MSEHNNEIKNVLEASSKLVLPLLIILLVVTVIILASANPNSYASSLQLKEKLLHDTQSPRLIIIGGSGAASSIDSMKLGEAFNLTPVNMGLFAGVGMRFILNQVKDEIREGDVVLLAPEYEMLQQPSYGDGAYLLQTLHANPSKIFDVITPHGLIVIARAFPSVLQQEGRRVVHTVRNYFFPQELVLSERLYTLDHVTMYGDLDTSSAKGAHLSTTQIMTDGDGFVREHIDPTNLSLIAEFFSDAKQKRARIFIVLPVIPEAVKMQNMAHVESQYAELVSSLSTEDIIGTPGYFTIPSNQFLDSLGHLTTSGKVIRTDLIYRALLTSLTY